MSTQEDCLAVLIPNSTRPLEAILVGVRGVVGVDRFVRLCPGLFAETGVGLTLYHVADPSVTTSLFGMRAEQVAEQILGPVLVVEREEPDDEDDEDE